MESPWAYYTEYCKDYTNADSSFQKGRGTKGVAGLAQNMNNEKVRYKHYR